jgi:hypothetical protein
VGNDGANKWDIKGLWKGYDHTSITENAFFLAINYLILPVPGEVRANIVERIVDGNLAQDYSANILMGEKHFSVRLYSKKNLTLNHTKRIQARDDYKKYLDSEISNFDELLSKPSKKKCKKALRSLGLLTHSWQDFFSHGIRKDGAGSTNLDGGSSGSDWPGWAAFSEGVTGTPDDMALFVPCTFNWLSMTGGGDLEHPSDGEPIVGPEYWARKNAAINYTVDKLPQRMERWIKACECWTDDM